MLSVGEEPLHAHYKLPDETSQGRFSSFTRRPCSPYNPR